MGISRDSWHKRRATGGKKKALTKKRKHALGRPPANTKLGAKRIHGVRCRGGNMKYRALRLDQGSFSWGSESISRKTRVLDVVYNASNNELVRTKTLVKNAVIQIDSTPFKQWDISQLRAFCGTNEVSFSEMLMPLSSKNGMNHLPGYELHYGLPLGRKKGQKQLEGDSDPLLRAKSSHVTRKLEARKPMAKLDGHLEEQFVTGRLYACVSSRPGQSGRCDGYILEGKELDFYLKKLRAKKGK